MKYEVTIRYTVFSTGLMASKVLVIEAQNEGRARWLAKREFVRDARRRNSVILDSNAVPLNQEIAWTEQKPSEIIMGRQFTTSAGSWTIVAEFAGLKKRPQFVIERDDGYQTITDRESLIKLMAPRITTEYWSVYPNGNVYKQPHGPIRNSQHPLEDLVQIKVTKVNGKITEKEFV